MRLFHWVGFLNFNNKEATLPENNVLYRAPPMHEMQVVVSLEITYARVLVDINCMESKTYRDNVKKCLSCSILIPAICHNIL